MPVAARTLTIEVPVATAAKSQRNLAIALLVSKSFRILAETSTIPVILSLRRKARKARKRTKRRKRIRKSLKSTKIVC